MNLDLDKAVASNNAAVDDHEIASMSMDGPIDQKETTYTIQDAETYWGIFNAAGDFKSAVLMKAIWNVGKGWTADRRTTFILDRMDGWGKDSFDDILFNMEVCRVVFGDAFAEIIRDKKTGELLNLKVLNPGDIKTVVNGAGRLKRYEFVNPKKKILGIFKRPNLKFEPNQMFHLTNNRIGNQIHGISDVEALKKTILAEDQSFDDLQKIVSFQAKPFIIFKMKTDDEDKIAAFTTKVRNLRALGDDMFIPDDENMLSYEVVTVNPSSILMEWRGDLRNKFYRQLGLPLILFGASGSTESGGKMETFAHEQVFEYGQRYIEKQVWNQLGKKIDLISPTSLLNNLQSDQAKDANQGLEIQPSDATAGSGR